MRTAEKSVEYKQKYDRQKRDFLAWYKVEQGCEECGYNDHPAALTFDHRDPSMKSFNIADYGQYSWQAILHEVAKCRVLCANCHNIHSFKGYDNNINSSPVSSRTRELMGDILSVDYQY